MSALHAVTWGDGEPVVLVHGSFGWGEETWRAQRELADTYRLVVVDRRGFGASPARPSGVDFDADADDIADVLSAEGGAHLVGHSYGGVGCLLAAARAPHAVRSLTVIEPPAFALALDVPEVRTLVDRIDEAARDASDPADFRVRFLRAFGFGVAKARLKDAALAAAEASWHERPPWEAQIPVTELARASIPTLVARGAWDEAPPEARRVACRAFHAVCDVLERELDAEGETFAGAAHRPQDLGGPFNDVLRRFLATAGRASPPGAASLP